MPAVPEQDEDEKQARGWLTPAEREADGVPVTDDMRACFSSSSCSGTAGIGPTSHPDPHVAHHPGLEPGSSRVTAGRLAIRPVVSAAQPGREPAWTGVLRTCGSLLRRLAASADRRTRTCTIRFWRPELYQLS